MEAMKKLLAIIARNEAAALRELLPNVLTALDGSAVDLLLIDSGSTDDTMEVAELHGINVKTVHLHEGGLNVAQCHALNYALENGYDYFVHMDGDGQHEIESVLKTFAALKEGADFVVHSRFHAESSVIGCIPTDRQLLNASVVGMTSRLGLPYSDPLCGLRGYSAELIQFLLAQELATDACEDSYGFVLESLIRIWHSSKFNIVELPHPAIYNGCGKISTIYADGFLQERLRRFQMHAGHIVATMKALDLNFK